VLLDSLARGLTANARTDKNESLLHVAAEIGHCGAARIALIHDVDVNCAGLPSDRIYLPGSTTIRFALEHGHASIVGRLIENGATEANVDTHGTLFDACLRCMCLNSFWALISTAEPRP
jgi:hypothetical protein